MVTTIQNITYRLTLNGVDFTSYVIRGDCRVRENEVPTGNVLLSNIDGLLTPNADTYVKVPISLNYSLNGGDTWTTAFSGMIETRDNSLEYTGEETLRLQFAGAGGMRGLMCAPNQLKIGMCDIGHCFVGTRYDLNGQEWTTDSKGNYPNGLLYKTGYMYSTASLFKYFPSESMDLLFYLYNQDKLLTTAISDICKRFGVTYFFDDVAKELKLYNAAVNQDYPSIEYTATYGENINEHQYSTDHSSKVNRVTVIGTTSDIFYSIGAGPGEELIHDDMITNPYAAMMRARTIYADRCREVGTSKLSIIPVTMSLIGTKITINDTSRGDTNSGNVVGVSYGFSPERFSMELDLNKKYVDTSQIMSNIMKALKEEQNKVTVSGCTVYLRADKFNQDYYDFGYRNICAIGVGTGSV